MAGATSSLHLIPEHHLVVAVVANSASLLPDEIRRKIIELMVPSIEVGPPPSRPQPQPAPQGEWSGKIATYQSDLPLRLKSDGEVIQVALGHAALGPLESAHWRDGVLRTLKGDLQLPEVGRCDYFIRLSLKTRGNDLTGSATAFSIPPARAVLALRSGSNSTATARSRNRVRSEPLKSPVTAVPRDISILVRSGHFYFGTTTTQPLVDSQSR